MKDRRAAWSETRDRLRHDAVRLRRFQESKFLYRPRAWFIDPAWIVVLLHRLSALSWRLGHRKSGRFLMQLNSLLTGADIHPASDLGGGLLIPSPCGVTISCKAGRDLTALALSGLGGSNDGKDIGAGPGLPVAGEGVTVGPFCGVQNGILLGDEAVILGGAGALKDVPPGGRMMLAAAPLEGPIPPVADPPERAFPACPHRSWSQTKSDIGADIDRYFTELSRHHRIAAGARPRLGAFLTNHVLATAFYRVAHWLHANGRPRLARVMVRVNQLANRLTISADSCIGGGLFVPHLAGTLFHGHAGTQLTLYANSLCAPADASAGGPSAPGTAPILGHHVTVGGHSAVIGPVTIGDHVRVATKAEIMRDLPDGVDAFSPMGRFTEDRGPPVTRLGGTLPPPPGGPVAWRVALREMRHRLRHDRDRLAACRAPERPGFPGLTCVRLHRLSRALFVSGHKRLARWAWLLNVQLTGADISPASDLGPGLLIPLPAGVCVHATAGGGLTLLAQSGVGPSSLVNGALPPPCGAPRVGHDVHVGHHSGIFGDAVVGDRVHLMPGCIATRSVADGVTLVPRPTRTRPRANEDGNAGAARSAKNAE